MNMVLRINSLLVSLGPRNLGAKIVAGSLTVLGLSKALLAPVHALPMSYAGSTTIGIEADPHWSSVWFSHAIDRNNGLGLSLQYLPANAVHSSHASANNSSNSHNQQGDETFSLIDSTHLLKRWNMPKAQANLWLFGGIGTYHASGSSTPPVDHANHNHRGGLNDAATETASSSLRIAARPGIQFDAESTRLRIEGKAMLYLAPDINRPLLSATAGAALSEPNYNGVQPWLELQVRSMPGVVDQLELIPKLRLLHHRLVLDIGYSSLGSVVGGLTVTF